MPRGPSYGTGVGRIRQRVEELLVLQPDPVLGPRRSAVRKPSISAVGGGDGLVFGRARSSDIQGRVYNRGSSAARPLSHGSHPRAAPQGTWCTRPPPGRATRSGPPAWCSASPPATAPALCGAVTLLIFAGWAWALWAFLPRLLEAVWRRPRARWAGCGS